MQAKSTGYSEGDFCGAFPQESWDPAPHIQGLCWDKQRERINQPILEPGLGVELFASVTFRCPELSQSCLPCYYCLWRRKQCLNILIKSSWHTACWPSELRRENCTNMFFSPSLSIPPLLFSLFLSPPPPYLYSFSSWLWLDNYKKSKAQLLGFLWGWTWKIREEA